MATNPEEYLPLFVWQNQVLDKEKLLVLEALGFSWKIEKSNQNLIVLVQAKEYPKAQKELKEYTQEVLLKNAASLPPPNSSSPLFFLNLMAFSFFFFCFGLQQHFPLFTDLALLDGQKIFSLQIYRLFSSLFIHKDPSHLLGNVFFSFYPVYLLSRYYSFSFTWFSLIFLGGVANGINVLLLGETHKSLGFSTASFVALGLLLPLLKSRKNLLSEFGLAMGIGLSFWALFSGGKHTDLSAHFFGLMLGLIFGWNTNLLRKITHSLKLQLCTLLGIIFLLIYISYRIFLQF